MERIRIQKLLRLTLVRKGRAVAKHPMLRDGVVEAVKASSTSAEKSVPIWDDSEPTWLTPATANLERFRNGQWG